MEAIDLIQKRIEALELQILPTNVQSGQIVTDQVTELLLQAQTMITSALSCRDSITSILRNMTTINEYLDPTHAENELEVEAKRHYLLELYPELKDTIQMIGTFKQLTPLTDSTNISRVVEVSHKIEELAISNLSVYENCRETTQTVLNVLKEYNGLVGTIKILFTQLDEAVTNLELALQPKFTTEE